MYKIWIRQPWDTSWQRYDHTKTYLTKFQANWRVKEMKKSNWWTDRTEVYVGTEEP